MRPPASRSRGIRLATLLVFTSCASPTVAAAADVEILIGSVGPADDRDLVDVELRVLNQTDAEQPVQLPRSVTASIEIGASRQPTTLERANDGAATLRIPPRGFASVRYRLNLGPLRGENGRAILSIPAWNVQPVAFAWVAARAERLANAGDAPVAPAPSPGDRSQGNPFLPNLSAYEPIYAVYGPGTNTAGRIQFSFKYQIFGTRARDRQSRSLLDGFHFAYTQRMFWDLEADSLPFHNVDYEPELFYLAQPLSLSDGTTLSGQIGFRHESNGKDGSGSRSLNTIYLAPMAAVPLGDDWRLTISPRLWLFAGDLSDNPDIRRYRGNSGLFVQIAKDEGLRLTTSTRFNFGSGKGAISADLSYPLNRLLGGGPDVFLFGQSFIGYGENLLDYDQRTTRFRLGLALVR